MLTLLLTVLLFCIMILPHELGHFITAKLCGVQVNEFALGMGPLIWQKEKGETKYSLRLIPIGGYCAMEGENEESENPRAFNNKKAWQKLLVLFAGAAMNILVAILIMIIAITSTGVVMNTIDKVTADSPAAVAGLETGDKILAIGEESVDSWSDTIQSISKTQEGEEIDITVERQGKEVTCTVKPELSEDGRPVIGIQATISHNFFRCVKQGFVSTWELNKLMYKSFKMLFSGEAGIKDVSGPVGIVQAVDQSRDQGFVSYLFLAALISLNLAFINLLPFPALDGGRIIFVAIRKITGNMITDEIEGKVHMIGMVLLVMLFVFVTWNDIARIFS